MNDLTSRDQGTTEATWRPFLDSVSAASIDEAQLTSARALIVVAPHPDDEILATGGLVSRAAKAGVPVSLIAITDGDASHPLSPTLSPAELATRRVAESEAACSVLSLPTPLRLHIADGAVEQHQDRVQEMVSELVAAFPATEQLAAKVKADASGEVIVLVTWRGDGHPDHEAAGRAAAAVCQRLGATLWECPIWMWHWATPEDTSVPWQRLTKLVLTSEEIEAKERAVSCFASQIHQLSSDPHDQPILTPSILERFRRPAEWIFT